jgi:lipopolysaccharide/colanic/teichoic acid biosynthesis glycosyltransferase
MSGAVGARHASGTVLEGVRTEYRPSARLLDLAIMLLVLPFLAPMAALVALAVALDSPGPVIYRSTRVGRDGRRFEMLKFRTMLDRAGGPRLSREGDDRYTPIGRLLASTRLDELPQAWNVLRGQMRLVGPRPEIECFVLDQADAYRRILAVPPGITGPTQLAFADEGRRLALMHDPERVYRDELLPQKVQLDLSYAAGGSLLADLDALARTFLVPARRVAFTLDQSGRHRRSTSALARAGTLAIGTAALLVMFVVEGVATL